MTRKPGTVLNDPNNHVWITGAVLVIIFQDKQSINGNTIEASNELS